ncbi:MAG: hypothetical protein JWM31_115 [Solirubrobacterales bacterium]|nr:hypothetical protein [Solirubrobacterales bacterium]
MKLATRGLLPAGLVLWALALPGINIGDLGQYGLLPALGPAWYGALVLLVSGTVLAAWGPEPANRWLLAGYIGAVVLVLYATIPAITDVPQYPWTYKHIGVTRLIEARGRIDPGADIYSRWPGFFALAAAFGRVAGLPNPVSWAAWTEPLFMAIDALLVAALAWTLTRQERTAAFAALVFVLINWVGQTYFAPQAAASALSLALLLAVLAGLGFTASPGAEAGGTPAAWRLRGTAALILGFDVAIVISHQLTPYALLAQVGALTLFGLVRAWPILLAMGALTLGFLVLNAGYVSEHFTLLTSFDPLQNLRHAGPYGAAPVAGKQLNAHAGQLLSVLAWGGALLSAWRLRRTGHGRLALTALVIAFAPFAVLFGQDYGGEATLRVILFSAPGCAILVAAGVASLPATRRRSAVALGACAALATLSVAASLGASELNLVSPAEVAVSDAFYSHAPPGSVLMLAGPGFPLRVGATYDRFAGPQGDAAPNLLEGPALRSRPLGAADLPLVMTRIRGYSPHGYLAFSSLERRWAATLGLAPAGALDDLERAVAASPEFTLWRSSRDARIYRLRASPRPASPLPRRR